jgi:hypothetical protein
MVSPFSILIFLSLSLSTNYLWSLLFWNRSVKTFHIAYGVVFPWILDTMWSCTPSNRILLAFATFFFHASRFAVSVAAILGTSPCVNVTLQAIVFKHCLHHVLPCNVVRVSLKCILQPQSIERHFDLESSVSPRKYCKFECYPTQNSTPSLSPCPGRFTPYLRAT